MAGQQVFGVGAQEAVLEFIDDRGEEHYLRPPQRISRELTRALTASLALLSVFRHFK
jgi:hypothetical protein